MQTIRELVRGLNSVIQSDGLPNRWRSSELANCCDLQPLDIVEVVRRRIGIVIDERPCRIEIEKEAGEFWINVDPVSVAELRP